MAAPVTGEKPKGKRGRPSKAEKAAREAAAAAGARTPSPPPPGDNGPPAEAKRSTAPGLGHAEPDELIFLKHVALTNRAQEEVDKAKEVVKAARGKLRDARQLAKAEGIVLKELDDALEDAKTERVDLVAKEERRRLYRQWLGLPLVQGDLFEQDGRLPEIEQSKQRWRAMGETDGRLGRERAAPEGCPHHAEGDYLAGWDTGQELLARALNLTKDAFDEAGELKPSSADTAATSAGSVATSASSAGSSASEASAGTSSAEASADDAPAPASEPIAGEVLILGEKDFEETVTDLDDANRKTLTFASMRVRFDAAERVVAVFGDKRRILKEPGYVDTGEPDVEISEAEPVPADGPAADLPGSPAGLEPLDELEEAGQAVEDAAAANAAGSDAEEPAAEPASADDAAEFQ